jgi:DNA-binding beta-propeller fold protein YncE
LRYPYGIDLAPDHTLMVCEYEGNRLQWFDKDGRSLRIWGRSGRAPGELFAPWGAAFGPGGNVYVVDALNSRVQIIQP